MVELTLLCVAANAEAVSDALIDDLGALSASVEDADAGTAAEQALFGEPGMAPPGSWDRAVVKALFVDAEQARQATVGLQSTWGEAVRLHAIEPVAGSPRPSIPATSGMTPDMITSSRNRWPEPANSEPTAS